jgi:hypothetical protein
VASSPLPVTSVHYGVAVGMSVAPIDSQNETGVVLLSPDISVIEGTVDNVRVGRNWSEFPDMSVPFPRRKLINMTVRRRNWFEPLLYFSQRTKVNVEGIHESRRSPMVSDFYTEEHLAIFKSRFFLRISLAISSARKIGSFDFTSMVKLFPVT